MKSHFLSDCLVAEHPKPKPKPLSYRSKERQKSEKGSFLAAVVMLHISCCVVLFPPTFSYKVIIKYGDYIRE